MPGRFNHLLDVFQGTCFSEFGRFMKNSVTVGGGKRASFFNSSFGHDQGNEVTENFLKHSLISYLINFSAFSVVSFLFDFTPTWLFKFSALTIIFVAENFWVERMRILS